MLRAEPEKQDRQDVVYKSGLPIVTSVAANSEVVIQPMTNGYELHDRVGYLVTIRNSGGARIEVAESSIRAWANGEPATVLRASQIDDQGKALQRTTLEPGETVSGRIVIETTRWRACPTAASRRLNQQSYRVPGPCRWVVKVAAGGDLHNFTFNESLDSVNRP